MITTDYLTSYLTFLRESLLQIVKNHTSLISTPLSGYENLGALHGRIPFSSLISQCQLLRLLLLKKLYQTLLRNDIGHIVLSICFKECVFQFSMQLSFGIQTSIYITLQKFHGVCFYIFHHLIFLCVNVYICYGVCSVALVTMKESPQKADQKTGKEGVKRTEKGIETETKIGKKAKTGTGIGSETKIVIDTGIVIEKEVREEKEVEIEMMMIITEVEIMTGTKMNLSLTFFLNLLALICSCFVI